MHLDGIAAAAEIILAAKEPVTLVEIAPPDNLLALARRFPQALPAVGAVVSSFGAIDQCYKHRPITVPGSCPEHNALCNITASRLMLAAGWPVAIAPLDTSYVAVGGAPWHRLLAARNSSAAPMAQTLLESLSVWDANFSAGANPPESDVIFDAVAMQLSVARASFEMQSMRLEVTSRGATVRSGAGGRETAVALRWANGARDRFFDELVSWLIAFRSPRQRDSVEAAISIDAYAGGASEETPNCWP